MKSDSDALYEAASTAVLLAGGSFFSILVAGLGSLVLARILGPEGYGAYSLVLAIPAFLMSFTDLGMSAAMIRYPPKYPERTVSYVTLGIAIVASNAFLVTVVGIIASSSLSRILINRPEYSNLVLISMPYLLSHSLLNVVRASLVGIGRRVKAALLEPLYNLLRIPLSIALATTMFTTGAVLGIVIASIISSLVGIALLLKSLGRLKLGFRTNDLLELLRFSVPLYATSLIGSLTQIYTTLTLSRFFTDFEIGNYRAALNLLSVISIAIAPLSTAFLRVFSELSAQGFREVFVDSIKYIALFSAPLALFSSAASYDIVRVVYGRKYIEAGAYFSIVALVNVLTLLGSHVLGPALSSMNRTKYVLLSSTTGTATYIPLLYVLVGTCGLRGAAISHLALSAITTLVQLYLLARSANISFNPRFSVKVLASSLIPFLIVSSIRTGREFADSLLLLLVKFLVFLMIYVTLLVVSKTIARDDIYRLAGLSKSLGPLSGVVSIILKYATLLIKLLQK